VSTSIGDDVAATAPVAAGSHGRAREHLQTAHLLVNLKQRTASGVIATGTAQAAQFVLNLVSIVVLARLLTPHEFGLVAMVTTVMSFVRIFGDGGLSTAAVQREGLTHVQVSNLFWANLTLGATATLIVALAAPVIASLYQEPRLIGITLALSLTLVLMGCTVQHQALLKRQLRFKAIAIIQVGAAAAGTVTGIGMAWVGFGYWSLVGMQLANVVVLLLLTVSLSPWRPQRPRRDGGTRSLLSFGADVAASSFMWSLARGADSILIGRMWGAAPLGLYSRAQALLVRPVDQLIAPFQALLIPSLSRLQADPVRYRHLARQAYHTVALVSFPLAGLLMALAHPVTVLVLGPRWESASTVFASFTVIVLYTPMASVCSCLIASQGRGRDFLRVSAIASLVTVTSFAVGLPFGPAGVATAYVVACLAAHLPLLFYIAGRSGPVSTTDLWIGLGRFLPLWGVAFGAVFVTRPVVGALPPLAQTLIGGASAIIVVAAFSAVYPPARSAAKSLADVLRAHPTVAAVLRPVPK
jgi:O-antigen/teichoic acid export membrane protein